MRIPANCCVSAGVRLDERLSTGLPIALSIFSLKAGPLTFRVVSTRVPGSWGRGKMEVTSCGPGEFNSEASV